MATLVLEGPNRAGKTTVGLQLADQLGLAYYRRRTAWMKTAETTRALKLPDSIVDRSWLTDIYYSKLRKRTPEADIGTLYYYGLLAAKHCTLVVVILPEDCRGDDLTKLYKGGHWTCPNQTIMLATSIDKLQDAIEESYQEAIAWQTVGETPSYDDDQLGTLASNPDECYALVTGPRWSKALGEALFAVGLQPREVHFTTESDQDELDEKIERYKPELILKTAKVPETQVEFDNLLNRLSKAFFKLGREIAPLEDDYSTMTKGLDND